MDENRLDARAYESNTYDLPAYDPAYVDAVIREARRMRNVAMVDMVKAFFDGRFMTLVSGTRRTAKADLPEGAAPQA